MKAKTVQKQSKSTAAVQQKTGQPFFQKQGEEAAAANDREAFFSSGQRTGSDPQSDTPFFQKTSSPFVQTKLTVGQPGDPYEQEADAMADKVVQRLAQPDADAEQPLAAHKISPLAQLKSNPTPTNHSSTSTHSHTPPAIIQPKCADCEKEEKKETEEGEVLPALQRKPIFESNDDGALQMKCAACEQEEKTLQPKSASDAESGAPDMGQIESNLSSSKGGGSALPDDTRTQMEGAFGADFSGVRIHTGSSAVQMNQDLQAQAFTHGSDVYFNSGKYDTGSTEGKRLLGHELTHVVQQGGVGHTIQRTTHGGVTPTNCHNWKIPMPPWLAGTLAHGQIAANLVGIGAFPRGIPRATKALRGVPNPPAMTPMGFADLWRNSGSVVEMAEIKSTSQGDVAAQADLFHYLLRHSEWLTRLGTSSLDSFDLAYLAQVKGALPPGRLDISGFTGTGKNLGPFIGDPLKNLWVEGDSLGSVVYWCTGPGLPGSPLLIPILKKLIEEAKKMMEEAKKLMEPVLEGVKAFGEWVWDNKGTILLIIAIIVAIVLIIIFWAAILAFLAAIAAAIVTALESLAFAFAALSAAVIILGIIGIDASGAKSEGEKLIGALRNQAEGSLTGSGEEGEPSSSTQVEELANAQSAEGEDSILAATFGTITTLGQMANPISIYSAYNSVHFPNPGLNNAINSGLSIASQAGHTDTAATMASELDALNA